MACSGEDGGMVRGGGGGGRHVQGRREAFLISVVFAAVWEVGEMRGYADKKTQG